MDDVLVWMADNDKLAGWAQTAGALLALFVALLVPCLQHIAQARREKLAELERNIYLSLSTMLLLRDALNLSVRVRELAHMPKHEINDPALVVDLLERLRILDAKDSSIPRQASQYVVRAAVLRINHLLDSGKAQSRELSQEVLDILQADASHMENEHAKLNFLLDDMLYQQTKLQVAPWGRLLVWYGFKTKAGRNWLKARSEKQAEQLKGRIKSKE